MSFRVLAASLKRDGTSIILAIVRVELNLGAYRALCELGGAMLRTEGDLTNVEIKIPDLMCGLAHICHR